jgi:hypothetical protein
MQFKGLRIGDRFRILAYPYPFVKISNTGAKYLDGIYRNLLIDINANTEVTPMGIEFSVIVRARAEGVEL